MASTVLRYIIDRSEWHRLFQIGNDGLRKGVTAVSARMADSNMESTLPVFLQLFVRAKFHKNSEVIFRVYITYLTYDFF